MWSEEKILEDSHERGGVLGEDEEIPSRMGWQGAENVSNFMKFIQIFDEILHFFYLLTETHKNRLLTCKQKKVGK